eukprot:m.59123 g.59123  ORF g.59123 m.59123 type:complete len:104 (-) comp17300_c1_seq1:85-396(-)
MAPGMAPGMLGSAPHGLAYHGVPVQMPGYHPQYGGPGGNVPHGGGQQWHPTAMDRRDYVTGIPHGQTHAQPHSQSHAAWGQHHMGSPHAQQGAPIDRIPKREE